MTWLLVEDDSDIRNVVAVMMSVWGEKPLPFPDGSAAWEWLDTVEKGAFKGELPELALLDIRMPGYTGDKVAARIRHTAMLKDIPIILMTAFSLTDSEIKEMMEQTGIDHLLNKPLPDMDVFKTTLYRIRDERKARLARQTDTPTAAPTAQPAASQPAPAASTTPPTTPTTAAPQPAAPAPVTSTPPATPAAPPPVAPAATSPATPSPAPASQSTPTSQPAQPAPATSPQPASPPAEPKKD